MLDMQGYPVLASGFVNRKSAGGWYRVQLAGNAEAARLAGPDGPLANADPLLGGFIEHRGEGELRLDGSALRALMLVPSYEDGRVAYEGDVPVMWFGRDRFPVIPEQDGARVTGG